MSQGDLADAARTGSSGGVAGNITDATIPAIAGGNKNSNITTELKSNTQHVPYVASGPDVRNTSRTSAMQPRSGYKANDGPKYFDPYDPWIGIRTAAILGGFLMLIVVYILYKARCRLSGSIEVTKVSYYQEYKDRCRERILSNIRARNNMANSIDRSHHHQGGDGVTSLDLTAKWIQSQPLCSAIPDESSEVKTPNLNRMQNRLHLSDIQLQTSSPDLRSPGGRERSKALLQLLRESNQDHFPINHRNFTAIGEFSICDGKVPNTDVANSSDLTYLSGQSPSLSNTHYHVPLIHNAGHKDSDPSIDENSNLPSTKLNADSVQIEMVPLSSHKDSSDTDERDSNSVKSVKSVASDRSPEQRTASHGTPLTNDSRVRSQSHSSLIPSASSMSSGLELIDPLRLITANGGPKLHKKNRSNGNIVTKKLDSQYALWRPPNNTVTKL